MPAFAFRLHACAWLATCLAGVLAGCAGVGAPAPASTDLPTLSDLSDAERLARVRLDLAAAYFSRGQNAVALDEVKQALTARPDLPEALNLRGLVYAAMSEPRLAEESFRRAMQVAPGDRDIQHNFGWFLCNQGRHGEADTLFRQILAAAGAVGAPRTQLARGVCLSRAGDLAQADDVLSRLYESDPANPVVAYHLGEVLFRRSEWDRARFYLRRLNARAEQTSPASLWLAARVEHRGGNLGARDRIGRELADRFPQSREALLFEKGRFDE